MLADCIDYAALIDRRLKDIDLRKVANTSPLKDEVRQARLLTSELLHTLGQAIEHDALTLR